MKMNRVKNLVSFALAICMLISMFVINAMATEQAVEYPLEINIMTLEERDSLFAQEGVISVTGRTLIEPNNSGGTNGNICAPFTADKTSLAFVVTSAPGATDYNVQLYIGAYGEGVKASDYAAVMIDNGVYFTGLAVGQDYYLKVSSSTLITSGSNAFYTMATY